MPAVPTFQFAVVWTAHVAMLHCAIRETRLGARRGSRDLAYYSLAIDLSCPGVQQLPSLVSWRAADSTDIHLSCPGVQQLGGLEFPSLARMPVHADKCLQLPEGPISFEQLQFTDTPDGTGALGLHCLIPADRVPDLLEGCWLGGSASSDCNKSRVCTQHLRIYSAVFITAATLGPSWVFNLSSSRYDPKPLPRPTILLQPAQGSAPRLTWRPPAGRWHSL